MLASGAATSQGCRGATTLILVFSGAGGARLYH